MSAGDRLKRHGMSVKLADSRKSAKEPAGNKVTGGSFMFASSDGFSDSEDGRSNPDTVGASSSAASLSQGSSVTDMLLQRELAEGRWSVYKLMLQVLPALLLLLSADAHHGAS